MAREREGDQNESKKRKGWTPHRRKAASKEEKEGQARRTSLEEIEGSMSG